MKLCRRPPRRQGISEAALLDEDFDCLKRVANGIAPTLGRPRDRSLVRDMLDYLSRLSGVQHVQAKRDVNVFLRFYLRVLRWTQLNQPVALYHQWYGSGFYGDTAQGAVSRVGGDTSCSCAADSANESMSKAEEFRVWLEQDSSFLAMKTFSDGSTIIYAAVSKNPPAGWVDGGLKSLRRRPECFGERGASSCSMTTP